MCMNCGASNHKIDYCYDFEPGTFNKRANFPREMPLVWPYSVSYKTNYEAIKNGDSRFGPQSRGGAGLLIPSPLTSKAPNEISLPAWFRPDPVREASLFGARPSSGPSQNAYPGPTKEAWSQVNTGAFNPPSGSKGTVAELRYASPTAYTTDLPLLPVSNPSRHQASSENFTKRNDALSQQRAMRVENAPPAQLQKAIELLFYGYPIESINMASSPTAKYSTVTFPSPEVAWQAFRGITSQPFYGYKVLVEVARKFGEPYLATVTFKEPLMNMEIELQEEEEEDDNDDDSMPARRKRFKTNHDQPGWHVWRSAEAEQRNNEQRVVKQNLHRSTQSVSAMDVVDGISTPPSTAEEPLTYHIGNLQPETTAGHLKIYLDSYKIPLCRYPEIVGWDALIGQYALVHVVNNDSAKEAMIRLSGQFLRGRDLKVRPAQKSKYKVNLPKPVVGNDDPRQTNRALRGQGGPSITQMQTVVQRGFGQKNEIPTIAAQNAQPVDAKKLNLASEVAPGRRTVASQLTNDITEQDLRDFFRNYAVVNVSLNYEPNIKRPEGYTAFIDFATAEEAIRATSELDARQDAGVYLRARKSKYSRKHTHKIQLLILGETKKSRKRRREALNQQGQENHSRKEEIETIGGPAPEEESRHLEEELHEKPKDVKPKAMSNFIRISDLPFGTTEADIRKFLGTIKTTSITLPKFTSTPCSAGYAIIEFPTSFGQRNALQTLRKKTLRGEHVTVSSEVDGDELRAGTSPLMRPTLPPTLKLWKEVGLGAEWLFREAVLAAGERGDGVHRKVLREWWRERGYWLDI